MNNQVMVERTEANRQKFSSKIKAPSRLKWLSRPIAARSIDTTLQFAENVCEVTVIA